MTQIRSGESIKSQDGSCTGMSSSSYARLQLYPDSILQPPSALALSHPIRFGSSRHPPDHAAEYFDLVDQSGRILRSDKRGAIDADLAPILLRIGANPQAWVDTISRFESRFRLAAGLISSLRGFADQLGRRWLTGVSAARIAFADSLPQST